MSIQGLLLTIIGSTVFATGVLLMLFANIKKPVCNILWENETVRYTFYAEPPPQHPGYVFSLQKPSLVKGRISTETGSFDFYICEYFDPYVTPQSLSKPKIYYKAKSSVREPFEKKLPAGNYWAFFSVQSISKSTHEVKAEFNLTECHDEKPHERWFSVGQTLWEVGIPILITGLVSLLLIP